MNQYDVGMPSSTKTGNWLAYYQQEANPTYQHPFNMSITSLFETSDTVDSALAYAMLKKAWPIARPSLPRNRAGSSTTIP